MTGDAVTAKTEGNVTINAAAANATTYTATVKLTQKQDGWQDASLKDSSIGGMPAGNPTAGATATITINADGSTPTLTYGSGN